MSHEPSLESTELIDPIILSRSLLALRRFLRGPFQRIGTACLVFALILNLSGLTLSAQASRSVYASSDVTFNSSFFQVSSEMSPEMTLKSAGETRIQHPSETRDTASKSGLVSQRSKALPSVDLGGILGPHLTHHRLTSARLSVPQAADKKIASLVP